MKQRAFTLSEVLITLGIIGVVAAITLPMLNQKVRDLILVAQAKKSYSTFLDAMGRMQADSATPDYSYIFSTGETAYQIAQNIAKYYNSALVCSGAGKGCGDVYPVKLANLVRNGAGGAMTSNFGFPRIIAKDGSFIYLNNIRSDCSPFVYKKNVQDSDGWNTGETEDITDERCASVFIDVNGTKSPNQFGADVHLIKVYQDIIEPSEGNYGCLKSIFLTGKLKYTNYDSNYKYER